MELRNQVYFLLREIYSVVKYDTFQIHIIELLDFYFVHMKYNHLRTLIYEKITLTIVSFYKNQCVYLGYSFNLLKCDFK